MAYLNRALTNFRNAVNAAYPKRDKGSDGWIGDPAHQATSSDHNPDPDKSVDAWDMDVDLRSDNDKAAIEELKRVFQAHPSSRYWIHNRIEASRSTGWRRVRYDGKNPHDKHVHWNTRESHEASTARWAIEGDEMSAEDVVQGLYLALTQAAKPASGDAGKRGRHTRDALRAIVGTESTNAYELREALASQPVDALAAALAPLLPGGTVSHEQLVAALREVLGSVDEVPAGG
jgi:hypothetical protein